MIKCKHRCNLEMTGPTLSVPGSFSGLFLSPLDWSSTNALPIQGTKENDKLAGPWLEGYINVYMCCCD